jgi:hypothetical protein
MMAQPAFDDSVPAFACPHCGSTLQLVTDGLVGEPYAPAYFIRHRSKIETRWKPAPFFACTGCEFCVEIPTAYDLRTQLIQSLRKVRHVSIY